jgi:Lon protease-like protein
VIRTIPLFPLPGVVLLPETLLPLHIFEERYRSMVSDALRGDRTIGMAMWKPTPNPIPDVESLANPPNPPIYPVGGAGEIVESEELEDGRFNIVLQARFRYRVLEEQPDPGRLYRVARVEEIRSLPFPDPDAQTRILSGAVMLFGSLARELELPPLPSEATSAERLASEIALRLRYSAEELQAILETDAIAGRFAAVTGRMAEWKARLNFLAPFRPRELDPRTN